MGLRVQVPVRVLDEKIGLKMEKIYVLMRWQVVRFPVRSSKPNFAENRTEHGERFMNRKS